MQSSRCTFISLLSSLSGFNALESHPLRRQRNAIASVTLRLLAMLAMLISATISTAAANTVIRVNVGGAAYTDSQQRVWSADSGGNGAGFVGRTTVALAGTSDPTLFMSYRYDPPGGAELQYSFAVPSGRYQVKLYFAESYAPLFNVGSRVFDVHLEGTKVLSNLDVFKEVGGNAALIKTTEITVSDGTINVELRHVVENPLLNAIEITELPSSSDLNQQSNTAPAIAGTPRTSTTAGQTDRSQASASDANGDPLTLTTRSAVLAWTPPSTNIDGSALTNLRGYRIIYGTSPNALSTVVQLDNAGLTSYVLEGLAPNTYYFAIRSYTSSGAESALSPVISAVIR